MSNAVKKTSLFCLAFLVIWALCVIKISPAYVAGDSPETIMAFSFLGIQHPPGYALNTLLGKVFLLVPAGNIMFRAGLMAAFFNIAAAFTLFMICVMVFAGRKKGYGIYLAASAGALLYLFSNPVFLQGLSAKGSVYTLHSFLVAAIFLSLFNIKNGAKYLYIAAFLFGLSLGNHWQSSLVLFPAMALAAFWEGKKMSTRAWLVSFLFFLAGASVLAFLFIRGAAHPLFSWGDVSDIRSFIWLFSRAKYAPAEYTHSLNDAARLLKYFFTDILPGQYPFFLAFALFPGAGIMLWKKPGYGYVFILAFVCYISGELFISAAPGNEWVIKQFQVFTAIFASVFIAWFFYWLTGLLKLKKPRVIAAFALLFSALYAGLPDYSRYFLGYDFIKNAIMALPPGSVYFVEGDMSGFGAAYEQFVNKKNINVVLRPLLSHGWYREQLKRNSAAVITEKSRDQAKDLKNLMDANKTAGVYYSRTYNKKLLTYPLAPMGIINKVIFDGRLPVCDPYLYFRPYSYRGIFDDKVKYDDFSRMFILGIYEQDLADIGDSYEAKGDIARAVFFTRRAFLFYKDDILAAKIGSYYMRMGDIMNSEKYLDEAIRLNPGSVPAYYYKAAVSYTLLKDVEKTRFYLLKVLEYDKGNLDAKGLLEKLDAQ